MWQVVETIQYHHKRAAAKLKEVQRNWGSLLIRTYGEPQINGLLSDRATEESLWSGILSLNTLVWVFHDLCKARLSLISTLMSFIFSLEPYSIYSSLRPPTFGSSSQRCLTRCDKGRTVRYELICEIYNTLVVQFHIIWLQTGGRLHPSSMFLGALVMKCCTEKQVMLQI